MRIFKFQRKIKKKCAQVLKYLTIFKKSRIFVRQNTIDRGK